jgi:hypothetical protein
VPFRTIRIISHLNKESIGGDGLWSVTVSHHNWWGQNVQISGGVISTGVVGANRKTVCRRDPDWVTQIF